MLLNNLKRNWKAFSKPDPLKAFTPRMLKVNPEYKTNQPKLGDIRILHKFFGTKVISVKLQVIPNSLELQLPSVNMHSKMRLGMREYSEL